MSRNAGSFPLPCCFLMKESNGKGVKCFCLCEHLSMMLHFLQKRLQRLQGIFPNISVTADKKWTLSTKKTAKHPTKKAPLKNKNNSSPLKKQQFFFEKRSKSTTSIHWIQGPLTPLWRLFWHQVLCLQRICNERHETWRSNHSSWEGHGSGCFWWLVLGGVLGDSKGRGGGTLKIRKKEKKTCLIYMAMVNRWLIPHG